MKQLFTKEVKDENHILKNTEPKKIFIESTNEKAPSISYFYSSSDNQSNFSLNSYSDSIDNSSNESNHIPNNPYYNETDEIVIYRIEKIILKIVKKNFLERKRRFILMF